MNNGIIYTRVSTKEQAEKRLSLENQEKECKIFARKGVEEVLVRDANIFRDKGESAKFADRPELQRMLKFVQDNKGKIDFLYIWKIDRLARNLGDYYGIKVALAKYGVRIISVTEPIDDDPVGRFLEAILAAAAQFDNEIRAIRSLTGMRMRVEQGEWPHSATIGYKKVNKAVVIDKEYADTIAYLLVEFSTGIYSVAAISRMAFEKGVKTKSGKPKSHEAMKKILKNLFYAGYTKNKLSVKIIRGRHTPLVDEEVIYKNIEILNKNKKTVVIEGDDLYSLRGTLLCTNCHKFLSASTPHGNGGHYQKYHCSRTTCTQKITGRKIVSGDVDVVHREFRELLEAKRPLNVGIARLYKVLVLKAWNDEYGKALESASQINRDIEVHRELKHATTKKFIADKITEQDRDEQIKRLDEKIEILEQEKVEMDSYVKEKEQIVDDSMTFIKTPDIFWNQAGTRSRQAIQKLLFPSGIPYDFETGFGTTKQIDSYLLLEEISKNDDEKSAMVAASGLEPLTFGL
jgi:site-specific DNA recombinase